MNKITFAILSVALLVSPLNNSIVHAKSITTPVVISPISSKTTVSAVVNLETTVPSLSEIKADPVAITALAAPISIEELKTLANLSVSKRFGSRYVTAFDAVVNRESSWNLKAVNASSGACGLMQKLPCNGINTKSASEQIEAMESYIADHYTNPINALDHENNYGWY